MPQTYRSFDNARARHDRWLLIRMSAGDPHARDVLVERFLPLARRLARRYAAGQDTYEDVLQVACVGLLKAIDGFDARRGVAFSSYAVPMIVGELKRYFRDRTWTVRPPRGLLERALRLECIAERMSESLCRAPTVDELAEELGLTREEVLDGLEAARAQSGMSLDATLDCDGEARPLVDLLGGVDDGFGHVEDRILLGQLGVVLSVRDHDILRLRFEEDMTQREIGTRLGVSQMQVSRLMRSALERLRVIAEHQEAMALA